MDRDIEQLMPYTVSHGALKKRSKVLREALAGEVSGQGLHKVELIGPLARSAQVQLKMAWIRLG